MKALASRWRGAYVVGVMKPLRALFVAAFGLTLAACATVPPPPPPPPDSGPTAEGEFRPQDFSWSAVPGKGRIDGRVTYRQGERVYSCYGASVILTPETPWTRRRMAILYASNTYSALPADQVRARTPTAPSGDYSAFIRRTACDEASRFSFQGLANGAWYVILVAKAVGGPDMAILRRVEIKSGRAVGAEL